jgi:hypothetical protein
VCVERSLAWLGSCTGYRAKENELRHIRRIDMTTRKLWPLLTLALAVRAFAAGNEAPNGAHYNVNLIGVPKAELSNFLGGNADNSNGSTIFMPLVTSKQPRNFRDGTCTTPDGMQTDFVDDSGPTFSTQAPDGKVRIYFDPNTEGRFEITDRDAVDGEARISIPVDPTDGNAVLVDLYVRVLGKRGGCAEISGYAADATGLWWYAGSILVSRTGGKSSFVNATDIFGVHYCPVDLVTLTCSGPTVSLSVFNDIFTQYFWEVNNFKARLIQMRFYKRPAA